jgi:hypothetical protein
LRIDKFAAIAEVGGGQGSMCIVESKVNKFDEKESERKSAAST